MTQLRGDTNLLSTALSRFDHLLKQKKLFWQPSTPEYITSNGFKFEFRIAKAFQTKPILKENDPGRLHATSSDPFAHPEPDFVLPFSSATHVLQLNKFNVYRPQFILHPKEFALQTDDLTLSDLTAAWELLHNLEEDYIVFFNCGVDAGSSQGYKHMQLIPYPPRSEFELFPDRKEIQDFLASTIATSEPLCPSNAAHLPYLCYLLPLDPSSSSSSSVFTSHAKILQKMRRHPHYDAETEPYDFVLTKRWICVIPRRHKGRDGVNTNSMGMMGLVWVKDQEERNGWERLGFDRHLRWMGVPVEVTSGGTAGQLIRRNVEGQMGG